MNEEQEPVAEQAVKTPVVDEETPVVEPLVKDRRRFKNEQKMAVSSGHNSKPVNRQRKVTLH